MAAAAVEASVADQVGRMHRLYLELASFTSAYLEHQDVEERVVMPALEAAIGVESTVADPPGDRRQHPAGRRWRRASPSCCRP